MRFVSCKEASDRASYGIGILTFNVANLSDNFFDEHLKTTDLILHELGHEFGMHTEHKYHEALILWLNN